MCTLKSWQRLTSVPTVIFFVVSALFGCGPSDGSSMDTAQTNDIVTEMIAAAEATLDFQNLDGELKNRGFTVMAEEAFLLFNESGVKGVLLPYIHTSTTKQAAIAIIRDESGLHLSTVFVVVTEAGVTDAEMMTTDVSGPTLQNLYYNVAEGSLAAKGCGGDSWCCFWNCMLSNCGGGAFGCLWSGPGFWYCLLAICGISTYSCWAQCY